MVRPGVPRADTSILRGQHRSLEKSHSYDLKVFILRRLMTKQTWITLACVELAYQAIVTCELAVTIRLVAILVPEHFKGHID